jgi:hypothetical protein
LIRSLRASAQRSTSVLFSFVLSLLIVAGSFAIRQSKTIHYAVPDCPDLQAVKSLSSRRDIKAAINLKARTARSCEALKAATK